VAEARMSRRLARVAAVAALALVLGACTGDGLGSPTPSPDLPSSAAPVPSSPEPVEPAAAGPESAAAAARRLCVVPEPDLDAGSDVPAEGPTPPVIADVMEQVERLRGFGYTRPVVAEAVTQAEIGRDLTEYADIAYPQEQMARRSRAWETIGVIPDGTNLRRVYEEYGSTQVIGYYDTLTGTLKFIGTVDPSPLERITLAHELTHAIDDQRFGLEKLDVLSARCQDEETAAALAVVEGNATYFMIRWAQTFLTPEEQVEVGVEAALQDTSTGDIPPFVLRLQEWSYNQGLEFVTTLASRGGVEAIDEAFTDRPVSTEQIIHPERYPNDAPTPVDVPDLSAELGADWEDLDVMTIGEAWLAMALDLRLDNSEAREASAGWDGATYRAWTDGDEVAVVLSTVWDSEGDADAFAAAMASWIEEGHDPGAVMRPGGASVDVLFASDAATLEVLQAVA
jgi:hypothetical protein